MEVPPPPGFSAHYVYTPRNFHCLYITRGVTPEAGGGGGGGQRGQLRKFGGGGAKQVFAPPPPPMCPPDR